jgi:phenylpropionate dioxygenase-like ring-hydroxylating dioxygenase large terminal subunit
MSLYPAAVEAGWHPIAARRQLRRRAVALTLMGRPLVLFQGESGPALFFDRCPHRQMALSRGRVQDGAIECPYHGWRFAADGRCTLTPGAAEPALRRARTLPVIERAGLFWTSLAAAPPPFPALPAPIEDPGFDGFWRLFRPSRAGLLDAIGEFLDRAHPHFRHRGGAQTAARQPVEVTIRIGAGRAEARYAENRRPGGLLPPLLAGIRSTSVGRFFAPATGQIAFEGPAGPWLVVTVFFTPESIRRVRPIAHFSTPKGTAPAWVKRALLHLFNRPVVVRDRTALKAQSDDAARFEAPRCAPGPSDFLLPAIRTLAAGEVPVESDRQVIVER